MEKIREEFRVIIIGAGLAGLTAAIRLAEKHIQSILVSVQPSERAQSVLAEGGINGALNTMGEDDKPEYHKADTMKAGCFIADEQAVEGLAYNAPKVIRWLDSLGVPFYRKNGIICQRNFGGQKKKRTSYAQSSTGKVIMSSLIDEARKYEANGMIKRLSHHEMKDLWIEKNVCQGVLVQDIHTKQKKWIRGVVLLAYGGMNGIFPEKTTGTTANSGAAAAAVFARGVNFSNLEMIQYHPTTIGISGKRCLVSEAARGEGGRLFVWKNTSEGMMKWYFMEEKYPELGNLMPRDVVAREMYFVCRTPECDGQVYLDLTGLSKDIWKNKLADLRHELIYYQSIDPIKTPVPVEPGIHYFMGGIDVDVHHQTNIENLYAAGECCSQYHGANRLGGNSILGAIYGGQVTAESIFKKMSQKDATFENVISESMLSESVVSESVTSASISSKNVISESVTSESVTSESVTSESITSKKIISKEALTKHQIKYSDDDNRSRTDFILKIRDILMSAMGIVRHEETLLEAKKKLDNLKEEAYCIEEENRLKLAIAMIESARIRKESRGAHYREDYSKTDDNYKGRTLASFRDGNGEVKLCRF